MFGDGEDGEPREKICFYPPREKRPAHLSRSRTSIEVDEVFELEAEIVFGNDSSEAVV